MLVNPVVVVDRTLNNRKIIRKIQKSNKLLKTKRMLKCKLSGVRFSHWACQGGSSAPCQLRHWLYCIYIGYSKLFQLNCNKIQVGGVA